MCILCGKMGFICTDAGHAAGGGTVKKYRFPQCIWFDEEFDDEDIDRPVPMAESAAGTAAERAGSGAAAKSLEDNLNGGKV